MHDLRKPSLTQSELNRSMKLSFASGATGTLWVVVCSPQPIFNVFISNTLGGSSAYLGLLVGVLSLASFFQLFSILIYSALKRKKVFWIITSTFHRLNGFVLAFVSFAVARGGSRATGLSIIFTAMTVSWLITNISSSGWWSWMAEIIPEKVRAAFFGRRSSIANFVNIAWFFSATVVLDAVTGTARFYVYGFLFFIGGIGGVIDILLHIFVPERVTKRDAGTSVTLQEFLEPLRSRNFVGFCFSNGLALFSINVAAPFIAPYITGADTLGAPNTWLGIMFVISQLLWILVSPAWGVVMDRFGRKPVVMIGLLFTLSWIGYFFAGPTNYVYILPIISLAGGLLAPAFWDGTAQLMLSLTPDRNRISFVAWYWAIVGLISAFGSFLGGNLDDYFRTIRLELAPGFSLRGLQIVILISIVMIFVSMLVLSRIREGRGKPVGFVFSIVTNPGIFRTFSSIGTISKTGESMRVARALRAIEGTTSNLAVEDVLSRLDDPDAEVREEAARALGRIGSIEAFDALISQLADPNSTIRSQAARALGRIGDPRAIPVLIDGLSDESDDLKEACIYALGEIGGNDAVEQLLAVFKHIHTDRLVASGAAAVSRLGILEAAWEIVPRMHETRNTVLRNQLAIALGNLLGKSGEFYQYVTGGASQKEARVARLFQAAQRNLGNILRPPRIDLRDVERMRTDFSADIRNIRTFVESEDHVQAVKLCEHVAFRLLSAILPDNTPEELMLEYAVFIDPRLGLWWWFLQEATRLYDQNPEPDVAFVDVLLAIYFLSVFRVPDDDEFSPQKP